MKFCAVSRHRWGFQAERPRDSGGVKKLASVHSSV